MDPKPIKIGLIAELTGPLSFMGIANANLTTMLVDDINARGGLLGRPVKVVIEDGETIDGVAKTRTAKLIDVDKVDVVVGGIYKLDPPGHQERGGYTGQNALHLHRAVRGTGKRSPDLLHGARARAAG